MTKELSPKQRAKIREAIELADQCQQIVREMHQHFDQVEQEIKAH